CVGVVWELPQEAVSDGLMALAALVAAFLCTGSNVNSVWLILGGGGIGLAARYLVGLAWPVFAGRARSRYDQPSPHEATVRVGERRSGDAPLPRRGVGGAGPRRPAALRAPHPRGRPGGAQLGDDPQETCGVPPGLRRLRARPSRPLRGASDPATPRGCGHREEPREDRGGGGQCPRGARRATRARDLRRLALAIRRRRAAPEHVDIVARGAGRDGPVARAQPGLEGARVHVRGADDLLRVHAGDGDGERSHDGLPSMAGGPAARDERPLSRALALLSVLLTAGVAEAGGSTYGIAPGARPKVEGRISGW